MSVYVDVPVEYEREMPGYVGRARSRVRWCHMAADTLNELHAMARLLGLRREWFQDHRRHPHYDLVPSKRAMAIKLGALPVTARELVRRQMETRHA